MGVGVFMLYPLWRRYHLHEKSKKAEGVKAGEKLAAAFFSELEESRASRPLAAPGPRLEGLPSGITFVRTCPECGSSKNHICNGRGRNWLVDTFRLRELEACAAAGPGALICRLCGMPVAHDEHAKCERKHLTKPQTFEEWSHVIAALRRAG